EIAIEPDAQRRIQRGAARLVAERQAAQRESGEDLKEEDTIAPRDEREGRTKPPGDEQTQKDRGRKEGGGKEDAGRDTGGQRERGRRRGIAHAPRLASSEPS